MAKRRKPKWAWRDKMRTGWSKSISQREGDSSDTHTHRTNDICHFWMCAQAQNDGSNDFFPKKKMLSIFRIDVDVDEFFFLVAADTSGSLLNDGTLKTRLTIRQDEAAKNNTGRNQLCKRKFMYGWWNGGNPFGSVSLRSEYCSCCSWWRMED